MSTYDKASLVLIPSGTKEGVLFSQKPTNGDGDFSFSRASAGTRVNADGLIEKETQNLLLQSNSFDTTWVNSNSTETGGQADKDGGTDAWRIDKTASGGYLVQGIGTSGVQTFSVYAKAGTTDWMQLLTLGSGTGSRYVFYDLTNGVIGSQSGSGTYGIDSNIESVGGGWYRCSLTFNTTLNDVRIYPAEANSVSASSGNIYIQDAQLEEGLVARDYIETTTTAVYGGITDNVPRLDYTDSSCPSLKLEPQRTNSITSSEYFDSSDWSKQNAIAVNTNNDLSPEGLQNATELDGFDATNFQSVTQYLTLSAGTFTFSVFLKKTTGALNHYPAVVMGSTYKYVIVNSTTGTYAEATGTNNNDSVIIESCDANWWRVIITNTISAGTYRFAIYPALSSNGTAIATDAAGANVFYGAQVEQGTYPTSYIPTYGTSVTRNADAASKTGISDLIGQTEGTLFLDFIYNGKSNNTADNFNLTLGTWASNIITIGQYNSALYARIYAASVLNFNQDFGVMTIGQRYKCAIAYASNDAVFYVNGVLQGSDTSVVVPAVSDVALNRGAFENSKRINQSLFFKTRLSNEELATLTTI